ncbi:unnamed protein product [Closterium sp. NIES-53]
MLGGRRPVVLTGHADASWADDQATQRSSQGYTFSLGSGSVSWRSTRSSSVLSSSCEAEIYAGAMAAQELRWLTYLLTDLGEQPRSPPVLYVDNKAMLALCREHRLEHRTEHIALRYFLARELQQRGQLRLAYVASEANTADIFTKALPPGDHQRFCTVLGLLALLCLTGLFRLELSLQQLPPAAAMSKHYRTIRSFLPTTTAVGKHLSRQTSQEIILGGGIGIPLPEASSLMLRTKSSFHTAVPAAVSTADAAAAAPTPPAQCGVLLRHCSSSAMGSGVLYAEFLQQDWMQQAAWMRLAKAGDAGDCADDAADDVAERDNSGRRDDEIGNGEKCTATEEGDNALDASNRTGEGVQTEQDKAAARRNDLPTLRPLQPVAPPFAASAPPLAARAPPLQPARRPCSPRVTDVSRRAARRFPPRTRRIPPCRRSSHRAVNPVPPSPRTPPRAPPLAAREPPLQHARRPSSQSAPPTAHSPPLQPARRPFAACSSPLAACAPPSAARSPLRGPSSCPFLHSSPVSGASVRLTLRSSPPLVLYELSEYICPQGCDGHYHHSWGSTCLDLHVYTDRPSPHQSQPQLQPDSPLPAPSPYAEQTDSFTERREPVSCSASPVRAVCSGRRVPRPRPPPVLGTNIMALRPSSVALRVPLPPPPESSLPAIPDPERVVLGGYGRTDPLLNKLFYPNGLVVEILTCYQSGGLGFESLCVHFGHPSAGGCQRSTGLVVGILTTNPSFEPTAASALVAELVDCAAAYRLVYATGLVAESESGCPPFVGGECALGTDVLEEKKEEFECLAAAVPHLVAMLLAPKEDPDAPGIPTPRSYAEVITGVKRMNEDE